MFRVEDFLFLTSLLGRKYADADQGVEAEDVEQELNLLLVESASVFASQWDTFLNPGAVVESVLHRAATMYVRRCRVRALMDSVQYAYRAEDVRRLLESWPDKRDWPNATVPEDAVSLDRNDSIEMSGDISRVWERLDRSEQVSIFLRYGLQHIPANGSAERKRLDRAVDALTLALNEYEFERSSTAHEGPGARRVIPNARAIAMTGRQR